MTSSMRWQQHQYSFQAGFKEWVRLLLYLSNIHRQSNSEDLTRVAEGARSPDSHVLWLCGQIGQRSLSNNFSHLYCWPHLLKNVNDFVKGCVNWRKMLGAIDQSDTSSSWMRAVSSCIEDHRCAWGFAILTVGLLPFGITNFFFADNRMQFTNKLLYTLCGFLGVSNTWREQRITSSQPSDGAIQQTHTRGLSQHGNDYQFSLDIYSFSC